MSQRRILFHHPESDDYFEVFGEKAIDAAWRANDGLLANVTGIEAHEKAFHRAAVRSMLDPKPVVAPPSYAKHSTNLARFFNVDYYVAPLEGGYSDSDDVPCADAPTVCKQCHRIATLPEKRPTFCSLDCVIDYCDPDRDEKLSSDYLAQEVGDRVEDALASDDNPLFAIMRSHLWRGATLERALELLERMCRRGLNLEQAIAFERPTKEELDEEDRGVDD